jgi:sirohydrochlorin ferrochelatase
VRLVTVAHGTRTPAGNDVAREITQRAGARLGLETVCSFVELSAPLLADVVAGSTSDLNAAASLLGAAWGGHVRLATLAGLGDRPADVVRPSDVVSPYLLAPGHFADRCRAEAAAGALVADVIGAQSLIVERVVRQTGFLVADRCA